MDIAQEFSADPANVSRARQLLRTVLVDTDGTTSLDSATLLLSEVVTNAFVHVGGTVKVHVRATADGVRVEVEDGSSHLPTRRVFAATAGTGRGLQLLDEIADRWGSTAQPNGKVVWFELGTQRRSEHPAEGPGPADSDRQDNTQGEAHVAVTLRHVPTLMHVAWQEHAAALLREYLLLVLDDDDHALERHAHASAAMSLLHDQLPMPKLPRAVDELMTDSVEPHVTADEVVLSVPHLVVPHFVTLDEMLGAAIAAARAGRLLCPPTQPEIDEMGQWLCLEVAQQANGRTTATPWMARTDVRATLADQSALAATYADLAAVDYPLLATDEASIIVAASPAACDLLGYRRAVDLLGRRVLVVVPARFHQAHIAGTTLHVTNGRATLLGIPVDLPMVKSDGTEVPVHIEVRSERLLTGHQVFVARFDAAI